MTNSNGILTKDDKQKIKICWEHIHFTRNMDSAAYSNILIKDLLKIIDRITQKGAQ